MHKATDISLDLAEDIDDFHHNGFVYFCESLNVLPMGEILLSPALKWERLCSFKDFGKGFARGLSPPPVFLLHFKG